MPLHFEDLDNRSCEAMFIQIMLKVKTQNPHKYLNCISLSSLGLTADT